MENNEVITKNDILKVIAEIVAALDNANELYPCPMYADAVERGKNLIKELTNGTEL